MTNSPSVPDRAACLELDAADPLSHFRGRFVLPEGMIYLDGNSLGPLPKAVPDRVNKMLLEEWGQNLIKGWLADGWMDLPLKLGEKLARLVGAASGEIAVVDTTSVNLFKLIAAALAMRPDRPVILSTSDNFPTDLYMAQGLRDLLRRGHKIEVVAPDDLIAVIDEKTALVMLTEVDFKSGHVHDMATITTAAHAAGALTLWDLAHSAGAIPIDLNECKADFAVGCSYKYLNAGPGGPAWLYVAKRHQEAAHQPLTGWLGHAEPFAFDLDYRPADGIRRHVCSSPGVLGLVTFEVALDIMLEADMGAIRQKSIALSNLFIELVEHHCGGAGLSLASPRDASETAPLIRGSQVSFAHPDGYGMIQALIKRNVIGDFRDPDILRFGFTPLYLRYVDVFDAVTHLRAVLDNQEHKDPAYAVRASIT